MRHRNGAEKRDYAKTWTHHGNKFVIGTIHGDPIEIIAQYNPKELARQAAATWNPHPNTSAKYSPTGESHMWSEYKTTAPRTMTVELLFDGYEEGISIAPIVEDLERLTIPVDLKSREESERRPQLCVAVWGKQQLRCIVQSVATKLTMFDDSGAPLRATCTVVLVEVDVVAMMKSDVHGAIDKVARKSGSLPSSKPGHEWPYPPEDSKPTRVPPPSRGAAPTPAPAATTPAPAPPPAPAPAIDETPDEVAADEKRAGEKSDADGANYQHGRATEFIPPSADSSPQPASAERDETPEEVAADEKREGERNDVDAAKYQHGTASEWIPPDTRRDSPPQQPAPDAVSSADSGTADPKYKAAAEDME